MVSSQQEMTAELVIYVAEHCPICHYAFEVADDIRQRFPDVNLRIVDLETADEEIPERVFATPTYLLNGRVWSLGNPSAAQPFFLYYPSNSNHSPYTPDTDIQSHAVKNAAKSVAGQPMDVRSDYIYENDVALGRLLEFLNDNDDPRRAGRKLIDNTIVIFTSDNGAEKNSDIATGPFRSNKGSTYEGGHRVPFIVSWPAGGVGDGDATTAGKTNNSLIGLQDMFATFSDVLGSDLADPLSGKKGGEDSISVLSAWRGERLGSRPMFFNDHKEAKADNAVAAFRLDDPIIDRLVQSGKWKLFFDAQLLRQGIAKPIELYDLATDAREQKNLVRDESMQPLVAELTRQAILHRTAGGHRLASLGADQRVATQFAKYPESDDLGTVIDFSKRLTGADCGGTTVAVDKDDAPQVNVTIHASDDQGLMKGHRFNVNARGLGVDGGEFGQVDNGETIVVQFDKDVIVESAAIIAGNGVCGGYYQVGERSPLAIYCVDADIDAKDQSGILSDIGLVKKGESLQFSTLPHYGVETPGRWRIGAMNFRVLP